MTDWYDKEQIYCIHCKHKWILVSNKQITDEQHYSWVENVWKQHAEIEKEVK